MQKLAETARRRGRTIGLVPTMGALHEGHLSLIEKSARQNDITIVSIFVNPTQFGPNEDFAKYPRAFKADCAKAKRAGAAIIFQPAVTDIYPVAKPSIRTGFQTYVTPGAIADKLEGAARPGHMRGVATICVKLFDICKPHRAYFGQKDAQQLAMIKRVVADLNLDLKIVSCPIMRSRTGVALSSRHSYLSASDLDKAAVIYESLKLAKKLVKSGQRDLKAIELEMRNLIAAVPGVAIEYIAFNRWDDLENVDKIRSRTLISMVAVIGGIRLLDNIII